jgi:hypothetical protein
MLDLVFDIGFVYSPNQDYEDDEALLWTKTKVKTLTMLPISKPWQ